MPRAEASGGSNPPQQTQHLSYGELGALATLGSARSRSQAENMPEGRARDALAAAQRSDRVARVMGELGSGRLRVPEGQTDYTFLFAEADRVSDKIVAASNNPLLDATQQRAVTSLEIRMESLTEAAGFIQDRQRDPDAERRALDRAATKPAREAQAAQDGQRLNSARQQVEDEKRRELLQSVLREGGFALHASMPATFHQDRYSSGQKVHYDKRMLV